MKKLLSILLTLVLTLSIVAALPVHAEETKPFKVGETTHATLADAYAALPEEGGAIELTADYTSDTDVGLTFAKPVTLKSTEGQKYTINLTAAPAKDSRWIKTTAALTLENVTVNLTRGIEVSGGDVLVKNSNVNFSIAPFKTSNTIEHWVSDGHDLFVITSNKLTLDGTAVTYHTDLLVASGALANTNLNIAVVKMSGGTDTAPVTLDLVNGSSITKTGWASCRDLGITAIQLVADTRGSINIGDGCSVSVDLKCDNVRSVRPVSCIALSSSNAKASVTLGKDSVLSLGNSFITTNNSGYPGWVMVSGASEPGEAITVTDNGCTYKVTPNSSFSNSNTTRFKPNLIPFHNISNATEGDAYYTADGTTYAAGQTHQLTAGQSYEFKFGKAPAPLLENISGASVRTDDPYGIRFGATVGKEAYDALVAAGNTVKFGMIVTNNELLTLDSNFFDAYDALEAGVDYIMMDLITYDQLAEDGTYSLSTYIENDPTLAEAGKEALTTKLYACAYYEITDAEGNTETVFAESSNARSIYDVAKAYKTNADNGVEGFEQIDFINNIVSVCEA